MIDPSNPFGLHLRIHILEASDILEYRVLLNQTAQKLTNVIPTSSYHYGMGHLYHMPGHVYLLQGLFVRNFSTPLSVIFHVFVVQSGFVFAFLWFLTNKNKQ